MATTSPGISYRQRSILLGNHRMCFVVWKNCEYLASFHLYTSLTQKVHESCVDSHVQEILILLLSNTGCDYHILLLNVTLSTRNYSLPLFVSFIYFEGKPAPHMAPVVLLLLQTKGKATQITSLMHIQN